MLNRLKHVVKKGSDSLIKAIAVVGTTLFITLSANANPASAEVKKEIKDILKKNPGKEIVVQANAHQSTEKTAKFEAVGSNDALTFAVKNVDKYYPDMKDHLDTLINSFRDQEQKDTVNFLFQQHIFKNITDPQKQVASIIYCIENFVFKGNEKIIKKFGTTYKIGTIIAREEYKYLFDFDKGYNKRFKGYYIKLEQLLGDMNKQIEENKQKIEENKQKIEENKQKIEENKQKIEENNNIIAEQNKKMAEQKKQIEGIINTFTVNDVKNNANIKKLILETEKFYIETKYEIYPHLAELIKTAKE